MNHIESPRTDDSAIEQEIKAKGLTAPRVTPEALNNNIVDVEVVKHVSFGGQILRWAVITTKNGYAVVGNPSVAVLSLIHISEPTRRHHVSRMPSSA